MKRDSLISQAIVFVGLCVAFAAVVFVIGSTSIGWFFPIVGLLMLVYFAMSLFVGSWV